MFALYIEDFKNRKSIKLHFHDDLETARTVADLIQTCLNSNCICRIAYFHDPELSSDIVKMLKSK